ncbi:hypothetical protein HERIO_2383 [Hepatospora eriocheir]|uniref:Uncharacterized protein n=1 Tax=Hepatospora eriocheir TaxID=1081669 RepID=A0A1X0Q764_9MICR|nr:hypothetical protein HERIO_2383 [Hepatospora eriocheir]
MLLLKLLFFNNNSSFSVLPEDSLDLIDSLNIPLTNLNIDFIGVKLYFHLYIQNINFLIKTSFIF